MSKTRYGTRLKVTPQRRRMALRLEEAARQTNSKVPPRIVWRWWSSILYDGFPCEGLTGKNGQTYFIDLIPCRRAGYVGAHELAHAILWPIDSETTYYGEHFDGHSSVHITLTEEIHLRYRNLVRSGWDGS